MSTLATESGGSVFSHESLVKTNGESKVAASVFGRVIASSAVPNACQVNTISAQHFLSDNLSLSLDLRLYHGQGGRWQDGLLRVSRPSV